MNFIEFIRPFGFGVCWDWEGASINEKFNDFSGNWTIFPRHFPTNIKSKYLFEKSNKRQTIFKQIFSFPKLEHVSRDSTKIFRFEGVTIFIWIWKVARKWFPSDFVWNCWFIFRNYLSERNRGKSPEKNLNK